MSVKRNKPAAEHRGGDPSLTRQALPHRVVLASAGTGKTYQLTTRFIRLLADGHAPGSILATTFTRAAAAEILDRVLKRLAAAAIDDEARAELAAAIERPLSKAQPGQLLRGVIDAMPRLGVGTIDSLFARLAVVMTPELGLADDWRITDAAQRLHELAAESVLTSRSHTDPEFGELIDQLLSGRLRHDVLSLATAALAEASIVFEADASGRALWAALAPSVGDPSTRLLTREQLAAAIDQLEAADVPLTKAGKPSERLAQMKSVLLHAVIDGDWEGVCDSTIARNVRAGDLTFSRAVIPGAWLSALTPLFAHAAHQVLSALARRTLAVHSLLAEYHAARWRISAQTGEMTFDDIPRCLRGAMDTASDGGAVKSDPRPSRSRSTITTEDLAFRIDGRYQHVLLDEFQDTSRSQFETLRPTLEEVLAHGDGSRTLLVVGDAKQSIYGWRQGEPGLLTGLADRFPQIERQTLSESHRSSPAVLNVVNQVFGTLTPTGILDTPGATTAIERFATVFEPHRCAESAARLDGRVRMWAVPRAPTPASSGGPSSAFAPPDDADAPLPDVGGDNRAANVGDVEAGDTSPWLGLSFRAQEAVKLSARVAAHHRAGCAQSTVAVLVRANKCVPAVMASLRALGVPAVDERGVLLGDDPSVAAVLSLLQLAAHPGDSAAWLHVAATSLGPRLELGFDMSRGATGDADGRLRAREVSRDLRRRLTYGGLAATVGWIVRQCDLPPGVQGHLRLEQLVRLAEIAERDGEWSIDAFVSLARETAADGGGVPGGTQGASSLLEPVRVLTIHRSKGLEFDAVVLPDLDHKLFEWPAAGSVLVERASPLAPPTGVTLAPRRIERDLSPRLSGLACDARAAHGYEELCVLYVALTRARRAVEIIVPERDGSTKTGRTSAEAATVAALLRHQLWQPGGRLPDTCRSAAVVFDTRTPPSESRDRSSAEIVCDASAALEEAEPWWAQCDLSGAPTPGTPIQEIELRPLRARDHPAATRLRRVSPSGLEGDGSVHIGALFRPPPRADAGRTLGTVAHALLEQIEWLDDGAPNEVSLLDRAREIALAAALQDSHSPGSEFNVQSAHAVAEDAMAIVLRTLQPGAQIAQRLSRLAYVSRRPAAARLEARREVRFAVRDHDAIVAGAIDRLVIGRDQSGIPLWAEVLDFKTDAVDGAPGDGSFAERVAYYTPQIQAYRHAAAKLLGVPPESVSAALLFTRAGVVVSV